MPLVFVLLPLCSPVTHHGNNPSPPPAIPPIPPLLSRQPPRPRQVLTNSGVCVCVGRIRSGCNRPPVPPSSWTQPPSYVPQPLPPSVQVVVDRHLQGHGAASLPGSVLHGAAPAYAPTHPQTPMTMGGLVFGAPGPVLSMAPAAPMLAPLVPAGAVSPFALPMPLPATPYAMPLAPAPYHGVAFSVPPSPAAPGPMSAALPMFHGMHTAHGGPMLHAGPPGGPMLASSAAQARALDAADGTIDGYFHGSKVCAPRPQGCIGRNRLPPPPPSRVPSLCPAAVPLTPSARLNGICNRQ